MQVPFSRPWLDLVDGDCVLRSMRDDDGDYELVVRWRADPRIAEWYGGKRSAPRDLAEARVRYRPRVLGYDETYPCIGELAGRAVAYVQFYPVLQAASYELDDVEGTWGVDLFVGEPDLWDTGLGTRVVRLVLAHLFETKDAKRVVIDPWVENARAIRSYEKAGFRQTKTLIRHEVHDGEPRDCLLMVAERPGV